MVNEPRYHEHDAESENWYYCAIDTDTLGHWFERNHKRPVNFCYEHRWTGTRLNPSDPDDCPCEAIAEQAYESAMHTKYGEVY
jgi:hypothetical protein